jgi:predicted hydrocarbon binding protein
VPNENSKLSGYHPVISYALLAATRSIDTTLYRSIVRTTSVTIESTSLLMNSGKLMGDLPLKNIIGILKQSTNYEKIVKLAGMEAFHSISREIFSNVDAVSRIMSLGSHLYVVHSCADAAAELTSLSSASVSKYGSSFQVELSASPFACCSSDRPTCGFYTAFLSASVAELAAKPFAAEEVSCVSMQSGSKTCIFILSTAN